MRYNEAIDGIHIKDDRETLWVSPIGGTKSLKRVAVLRVALPAPILIFPGKFMKVLEQLPLMKRYPRAVMPINLGVITVSVGGAPFCDRTFPPDRLRM